MNSLPVIFNSKAIISNVLCYSVLAFQDLSVASSVSLIRMLGNVETKSSAMLLSVHHLSEMKNSHENNTVLS